MGGDKLRSCGFVERVAGQIVLLCVELAALEDLAATAIQLCRP